MNWKVLVAVASTLLVLWFVHDDGKTSGRLEGQIELTQLKADLSAAKVAAAEATEQHQIALETALERMKDEHTQAMGEMQHSAAASRNESDGLRGKLKELEGRLRGQSDSPAGAGFQLSSATKAAMVLSELLSSCSAERSELAIALDESYARGRAVEAQYNKARGQ